MRKHNILYIHDSQTMSPTDLNLIRCANFTEYGRTKLLKNNLSLLMYSFYAYLVDALVLSFGEVFLFQSANSTVIDNHVDVECVKH